MKQGEDGVPVAEICRRAGISQATYFNWRKKYAGLMPSEMKRLRESEDENNRLKRIVADVTPDVVSKTRLWRDELLNETLFRSLWQAQRLIAEWQTE